MAVPTEEIEWQMLSNWLRAQWYKYTHIANEIGISWHIGMLINKKKVKQWLNKWFPDYCVILKRGSLAFVELKRQRITKKNGEPWASPSTVSPEQIEWIYLLDTIDNITAKICHWFEEAKQYILSQETHATN